MSQGITRSGTNPTSTSQVAKFVLTALLLFASIIYFYPRVDMIRPTGSDTSLMQERLWLRQF